MSRPPDRRFSVEWGRGTAEDEAGVSIGARRSPQQPINISAELHEIMPSHIESLAAFRPQSGTAENPVTRAAISQIVAQVRDLVGYTAERARHRAGRRIVLKCGRLDIGENNSISIITIEDSRASRERAGADPGSFVRDLRTCQSAPSNKSISNA